MFVLPKPQSSSADDMSNLLTSVVQPHTLRLSLREGPMNQTKASELVHQLHMLAASKALRSFYDIFFVKLKPYKLNVRLSVPGSNSHMAADCNLLVATANSVCICLSTSIVVA